MLNQKSICVKTSLEALHFFLLETYSAYFHIKVFKTYSKEPIFFHLAFSETWPGIHVIPVKILKN